MYLTSIKCFNNSQGLLFSILYKMQFKVWKLNVNCINHDEQFVKKICFLLKSFKLVL